MLVNLGMNIKKILETTGLGSDGFFLRGVCYFCHFDDGFLECLFWKIYVSIIIYVSHENNPALLSIGCLIGILTMVYIP